MLLKGIENFTIIGQGNSTVDCNGNGSVKFVSCNNVTVKNVNWEGVVLTISQLFQELNFTILPNTEIHNCSFHHSIGQAVVLSKASRNVSINNC